MSLIEVVVSKIVQETPTIKSFQLTKLDGTPIGHYMPGAHIDVVGPTAMTRQYSLCGRPDGDDAYLLAVKLEEKGRGGSSALHGIKVGDKLKISEPRNLFGYQEEADHHILVAAGIGITPMLSMARYMDVRDISFELHYFARSEEEAAFLPLLRERCPEKLHAHLGLEAQENQPQIFADMFRDMPENSAFYVCGPGPFMDIAIDYAKEHLPNDRIHFEKFKADDTFADAENTEFEVELEDEVYTIPADRSIADVLIEAGCDVDTSCAEGICGTCIMEVLEGEPEHRDSVLTDAEREANETMAICVSRSKSPRLKLEYY